MSKERDRLESVSPGDQSSLSVTVGLAVERKVTNTSRESHLRLLTVDYSTAPHITTSGKPRDMQYENILSSIINYIHLLLSKLLKEMLTNKFIFA